MFQGAKNKTIGIFAPSSYVDPTRFQAGLDILHAHGYKTIVHPQTFLKEGQSAGSHKDKLTALDDLFTDDTISLVMAAAGGNRAMHLLDQIPYEQFQNTQKLFCGYSDSTALHFALTKETDISCIFGPMVQNLPNIASEDLNAFFNLIEGKLTSYNFDKEATIIKEGECKGKLIGGTHAMVCALQGTPYMPKTDNHILFLEDCYEELSRIDRAFAQLKLSLPFSKLGGLIIGKYTNILDTGRRFGYELKDIVEEHSQDINGPVIMNAPIGHGKRLKALPFGKEAELSVDNKIITLNF